MREREREREKERERERKKAGVGEERGRQEGARERARERKSAHVHTDVLLHAPRRCLSPQAATEFLHTIAATVGGTDEIVCNNVSRMTTLRTWMTTPTQWWTRVSSHLRTRTCPSRRPTGPLVLAVSQAQRRILAGFCFLFLFLSSHNRVLGLFFAPSIWPFRHTGPASHE